MSNTGWVIAGQGRNIDQAGQGAWTNPGNITADDGSDATNAGVTSGGDTTDWIVADTFALSSLIPANATITGFEFRIQAKSDVATGGIQGNGIAGVNVGKGDATLGTQKTTALAITTSMADYFFGGPQDLWGLTWTRTEAVAAGTQARAFFGNAGKSGNVQFNVDVMWIRVWFTIPGETVIFLTGTGAGLTWTVPNNWNSLNNTVECIGGGGNTGAYSGSVGGGAGGGAYSLKSNVALNPGTQININVGDGNGGDTLFNGTTLGNSSVSAEGGNPNSGATGGTGGQAANGIGDTKFSGGTGGDKNTGGLDNGGGGGGGSAGPHGNGANGATSTDNTGEDGGAGGGGADGGGVGSANSDNTGGAGGINRQGQAGGASTNGVGNAGSNGSAGSGGGAGSLQGGAGSFETLWKQTSDSSTAGPGSGAGSGGGTTGNSGNLSGYGGGAGGSTGTNGAQGIIVISYFANASKTRTYIVG